MLYIRLFHGRTDPNQDMDEWGSDGPVFGPYQFVHTTYTSFIKFGKSNGYCDEMFLHKDMLYYEGVYYGDWSIFSVKIFKESQFQVSDFEQYKAKLPAKSCS